MLKNESTPRIFWKLARVTELIKSKDNEIRAAKVIVVNSGKGRAIELRRPIQHLVPLELKLESEPSDTENIVSQDEESEPGRRPKRTAAVIGELFRRDNLDDE